MEFAVFLNGYIPGPAAHDSEMQHLSYMREAEYAILADKHNWKYCWFGEHHGLVEYSQLSAPEVAIGYVAAQTDYIHLGTAHQQPLAPQGAPGSLRRAGRHHGPLHQQPVRVRHRPRRRLPRDEVLQHHGQGLDQAGVERGRPRDPEDVGAHRLRVPRRDLHRAHAAQHPPQALRQGPPADLGRVRQPAHVQDGGRDGHRRHRLQLRAHLRPAWSHRGLQGGHRQLHRADRPVQERQRDDHQLGDLLRDP